MFAFKVFFLSLVSSNFIMITRVLFLCLSCLFLELLLSVGWYFQQIWTYFGHYFFKYIFSDPTSTPRGFISPTLDHLITSHRSLRPSFLNIVCGFVVLPFSLCASVWKGSFANPLISLLIFLLQCLICCETQSVNECFLSDFVFFRSVSFIWFFF